MDNFSIDLYLWYEEAGIWLLLPPLTSSLDWNFKLSQSEILACQLGVDFRIGANLFLGNERDTLPLDVAIFELARTIQPDSIDGFFDIKVSDLLKIEIKKHGKKVLLSRVCSRDPAEYFEKVAHMVGSYYKDFPVSYDAWQKAVDSSLKSLSNLFRNCSSDEDVSSSELASFLLS